MSRATFNARRPTRAVLTGVGLLLAALPTLAQDFATSRPALAAGGGTSTGTGFQITGTIGQAVAVPGLTGGAFTAASGFWNLAPIAPVTPVITGAQFVLGGGFQLTLTGASSLGYPVLTTTNLALPFGAWTLAGTATNTTPGAYQFTAAPEPGNPLRFFAVRAP